MNKIIFYSIIILFLVSCTSSKKISFDQFSSKRVFTSVLEDQIEINFDESGKFDSLQITVSERVKIDLPGAKDLAVSRSLEKSKKQILWLIKSSSDAYFINSISRTLEISGNMNMIESKNIANNLSKNLKKKRDYILDSIYIDRETYYRENKSVTIVVKTSSKIQKTVKKIEKMFE
tara:strand:- start:233 stop:760 length:528 start_codon:yes stop_codon:yes gene_type:complete